MNRYKKANEGIHAPEDVKEKTVRPQGGRGGYTRWAGAAAALLAVVLIGGIAVYAKRQPTVDQPAPFSQDGPGIGRAVPEGAAPGLTQSSAPPTALTAHALSLAAYPEMHPYPKDEDFFANLGDGEDAWEKAYAEYDRAYAAWREDLAALRSKTNYNGLMEQFLSRSTAQFLSGAGAENRAYSPLNVYMALSMLAEIAGENSRAQILELLQVDSVEALRERAAALWRDNYRDDGAVTSVLGNSLWLRDGMTYSQEVLNTLAERYYASSFSGKMGSEEYNQALRDWLNEQTHGLLAEQAQGLEMKPQTVLALASTLYFKAAWGSEFNPENTETDTFHALSGDVDADFMHKTIETGAYYWGEHFAAVELGFQEGGSMWLILPDEGYAVDKLLDSGEAMDFLLCDRDGEWDYEKDERVGGWPGQKRLKINLSMPKFDVSSDLDLIEGLKALGVTDVFDPGVSNFEPLEASTGDPLYVGAAQHAARVKVDEEGCEAAAYTVMMVDAMSAMPLNEEVDFVLDRPFLFAVTGDSGLPLFTGVVNQPNG